MIIQIHVYPHGEIVPIPKGYIDLPTFNADKCFELCNWPNWSKEKPHNLYSDIDFADHGVCFINPETGDYWLAKSVGWLIGDRGTVDQYVEENKDRTVWI